MKNISAWQIEFAKWQAFSAQVRQHVKNTESMIDRDLRKTALKAGLDPQIASLHAHNALCGLNTGHPWHECDYSLVRRVLWLEQRGFRVSRLGDRIVNRAYRTLARQFNMPSN